jgi:hypothetical protein
MTDKPWPPPPDLDSIESLVATADIEGFIAEGSPADEYEVEAEELFNAISHLPTADLTTARLLPLIEEIWQRAFALNDGTMIERRPKLEALAGQIERFFGPEARPQVRGS